MSDEAMFLENRVPPQARDAYQKDATAGMLGAVMTGLTGPFIAVIARDTLHATAFEIALLSMSGVAGSLFSMVWARMASGGRAMRVARTAWIVGRSLFILMLFAVRPTLFVALVAAINVLASIGSPAYAAIMREVYPDGDRARIMAYARVCTWCVALLVTAVASWLLGVVSYRYVFPAAALFGIASAIRFGQIRTEPYDADRDEGHIEFFRGSISVLREDAGFRWFCGGIFLFGFANFVALPIYSIYQVDVLGVKTQWAGAYSIVAQMVMLVSLFFWGNCVDRMRPEKVIAGQALAWSLIPFTYCVASAPWMLLPAMVVSGLVSGGVELSYLNGVLRFAPAEKAAQYQGVFQFLVGVRGLIGPYVGATLLANKLLSMTQIFAVSGLLILISAGVLMLGMGQIARRRGEAKTP